MEWRSAGASQQWQWAGESAWGAELPWAAVWQWAEDAAWRSDVVLQSADDGHAGEWVLD